MSASANGGRSDENAASSLSNGDEAASSLKSEDEAASSLGNGDVAASSMKSGDEAAASSLNKGDDAASSLESRDDAASSLERGDGPASLLNKGHEVASSMKSGDDAASSLKKGGEVASLVNKGDAAASSSHKAPDSDNDSDSDDNWPESLICPITQDVMSDPVILVADSHSYERSALERWFATGRRISPLTGEVLSSMQVLTNYALRYAIEEYATNKKGKAAASSPLTSPRARVTTEGRHLVAERESRVPAADSPDDSSQSRRTLVTESQSAPNSFMLDERSKRALAAKLSRVQRRIQRNGGGGGGNEPWNVAGTKGGGHSSRPPLAPPGGRRQSRKVMAPGAARRSSPGVVSAELLEWLAPIGCEAYAPALADAGCDSLAALHFLTEGDLDEFGVKRIHKRMILAKLDAAKTRRSPPGVAPSRPSHGSDGSDAARDDSPNPRKKRRSRGRKRRKSNGAEPVLAGTKAADGVGDRDSLRNFRSEFASFAASRGRDTLYSSQRRAGGGGGGSRGSGDDGGTAFMPSVVLSTSLASSEASSPRGGGGLLSRLPSFERSDSDSSADSAFYPAKPAVVLGRTSWKNSLSSAASGASFGAALSSDEETPREAPTLVLNSPLPMPLSLPREQHSSTGSSSRDAPSSWSTPFSPKGPSSFSSISPPPSSFAPHPAHLDPNYWRDVAARSSRGYTAPPPPPPPPPEPVPLSSHSPRARASAGGVVNFRSVPPVLRAAAAPPPRVGPPMAPPLPDTHSVAEERHHQHSAPSGDESSCGFEELQRKITEQLTFSSTSLEARPSASVDPHSGVPIAPPPGPPMAPLLASSEEGSAVSPPPIDAKGENSWCEEGDTPLESPCVVLGTPPATTG